MVKTFSTVCKYSVAWARDEALLTSLHSASAQGTPEDNVGLFCQLARESGSAAMSVEEPLLVA